MMAAHLGGHFQPFDNVGVKRLASCLWYSPLGSGNSLYWWSFGEASTRWVVYSSVFGYGRLGWTDLALFYDAVGTSANVPLHATLNSVPTPV